MKNLKKCTLTMAILAFSFTTNQVFGQWVGTGPVYTTDKVGIGITNPVGDLQVNGDASLGKMVISPSSSNNNAELFLAENPSGTLGMSLLYDGQKNALQITGKWNQTLYGPHLTIERSSGNVGIGTENPDEKLEVKENIAVGTAKESGEMASLSTYHSQFTTGRGLLVGDAGAILDMNNSGLNVVSKTNLRFFVDAKNKQNSSTQAMVINKLGDVGIGTTTPERKLHLYSKNNETVGILIGNGHTSSAYNRGLWINYHGANQAEIWNFENTRMVFATNNSARMIIQANGNVGIGTFNPQSKLAVNGKITTKEVEVTPNGWADFVFEADYQLKPLAEVEKYITENKHLPDVPSESKVLEKGVNLGEMDAILLQKIEELTLYLIQLEKELDAFKANN